jgi:hypothetical protein
MYGGVTGSGFCCSAATRFGWGGVLFRDHGVSSVLVDVYVGGVCAGVWCFTFTDQGVAKDCTA